MGRGVLGRNGHQSSADNWGLSTEAGQFGASGREIGACAAGVEVECDRRSWYRDEADGSVSRREEAKGLKGKVRYVRTNEREARSLSFRSEVRRRFLGAGKERRRSAGEGCKSQSLKGWKGPREARGVSRCVSEID